ncbi:5-methylcytosine-specific restriction protein A [Clostridium sp. KNHs216]|nr:5-methylcytosine-specific restriction protein A [Clostridium sp. KNHs216]
MGAIPQGFSFTRKEVNYMPYKPKRPCAYPGCGRLAISGQYCVEHQKQTDSHYNHFQREPETNKRYGRTWKRIRDRFIKAHPLCEACKKSGRLTPAEEVHHILPLSQGGTNDVHNLMALCKACHSRITLEANKNNRES